ncbi:hypothetical protein [Kibdelosporangium aridum]|uniref:hypothetical protein n=1 Tax=Kibdelosporangium aridum TaxID=2030 RepID=UPI0035E545A3
MRSLLEDQGIRLLEKRQRKLTTPNIRGFIPAAEWVGEFSSLTRPELALKVERLLQENAVADLDSPAPIVYAQGTGEVVFGEFADKAGTDLGRAVMLSPHATETGRKVAVCLFGSMGNFADFVIDAGAPSKVGWTASSAPAICKFLKDECRTPVGWESVEELARGAVMVACSQGENGVIPESRRHHGWNRGYTYGDILNGGEWLAEIYFDFDFEKTLGGPEHGYHRALIGAPLWLRTASPREVRLYANYAPKQLDKIAATSHKQGIRSLWTRLRRGRRS